jgi:hypothetical protein
MPERYSRLLKNLNSKAPIARFHKLGRAYKAVALLTFSSIVLFALLNLTLWPFSSSRPVQGESASKSFSWEEMRKIYPDLDGDQMLQLLAETWSRPFVYEPYTHFKEAPFTGQFINVDTNGFRRSNNQGPWPPDTNRYNVFLFGGSTLFGYGVPDTQTIASYLQGALSDSLRRDVRVYNFGRGAYHSVQERILFEQLLLVGFIPHLAIFVDGLNEFYFPDGGPLYATTFEQMMNGQWAREHRYDDVKKLPAVALANRWLRKPEEPRASRAGLESDHSPEEIRSMADAACQRYLNNRRLTERIAAANGVKVCFVWQPVPTYKYDLKHHLFQGPNLRHHWLARHGYERMADMLNAQPGGINLLWCADVQASLREPLYVDSIHYSARMSDLVARHVARLLIQRQMVP